MLLIAIMLIVYFIAMLICYFDVKRAQSTAYSILNKQLLDISDDIQEARVLILDHFDKVEKDTRLNRVDLTAIRDKVSGKKKSTPPKKKTKE